jgi:SAM-dependent methyltransferase
MSFQNCPLCHHNAEVFITFRGKEYFECNHCCGIFMDKQYLPGRKQEEDRYKQHINDVNDSGYQNFVVPIVQSILKDFTPLNSGLDFGAGTGPVISKLLSDSNYKIEQYDPFFHDFPDLLHRSYDYIACCEVIEHFHTPDKEFRLLYNLLANNGKLYCMTTIFKPDINFLSWKYKDDLTHVFFYTERTFEYIFRTFEFSGLKIEGNLIILSK